MTESEITKIVALAALFVHRTLVVSQIEQEDGKAGRKDQ